MSRDDNATKAATEDPARRTLRKLHLALATEQSASVALKEVAHRLCISPRTLKRHLNQHGLQYRQLMEARRYQGSVLLLATTALGMEIIAERIGYSSAANFARAFRRWTGLSPAAFRKARCRKQTGDARAAVLAGPDVGRSATGPVGSVREAEHLCAALTAESLSYLILTRVGLGLGGTVWPPQ